MREFYMIGNTHFDPVWLWRWDEALSAVTATFRSALERMEAFPEFRYSFMTPPVMEWIRKTDGALYDAIARRIAQGRWELAEGWWVQPDCYSAAGESYVRQGLYGQRYCMAHFGRYADTVFNIDSFGHSPMLPQILRKSGVRYYCFVRPEARHLPLEQPLFTWRAPDGSQVTTFRAEDAYSKDLDRSFSQAGDEGEDLLMVYGVTDHGGAPTIAALERIRERENAHCATVQEFFAAQTSRHTVEGELLTGDFGPYVNHPDIKAMNRRAEYALLRAERVCVLTGEDHRAALTRCWEDVLFNQFHDILGGACIQAAYEDAAHQLGRAIATAEEILHFGLQRITNRIAMPGRNPENPWNLVLWNLHVFPVDEYVEAEIQWMHEFDPYDGELALEDDRGSRIPCQIIPAKAVIPGFRSRFVFRAALPALGYRAYRVVQLGSRERRPLPPAPDRVETEGYVFSFDTAAGTLSVYDKRAERETLRHLFCPVAVEDAGDTWCFNIDRFGPAAEPFTLRRWCCLESGPLRTVLKGVYAFRDSLLELYYTLWAEDDRVDVRYRVRWNEQHLALKLRLPTGGTEHTVSVPYGSVRRGRTDAEVPMGEWIRAGDMLLAADHAFAYNMTDEGLMITLLRSAIYGDLRLGALDEQVDYDYLSQGITEGRLRLFLREPASAVEAAAAWNDPPVALIEANHGGDLPPEHSYGSLTAQSVTATVIKPGEEGGVILRCVETAGRGQRVRIDYAGDAYETDMAAWEIATFRRDDAGGWQRVTMLEEPEEPACR